MKKKCRTYTELISLPTYEERFKYLRLDSEVGVETFGSDRWLNQSFYKSDEWKKVRRDVILRDTYLGECMDLAHKDFPINGKIIIHHLNPIRVCDISDYDKLLDPENLVCVSHTTHNAIHYGSELYSTRGLLVDRSPNDTCPWKGENSCST